MNKGLKWLYSVIGVLLLTLLGFVAVVSQRELILPAEFSWLNWDLHLPYWIEDVYHHYYFWLALVFFILVFVAVIVVIFYPRIYTEIPLSEKNTSLVLKKSALEGYVRTAVKETGLMENPSVVAQMYKKKFKLHVKGALDSRFHTADKIEGLKKGIEEGLQSYFGLGRPVDFKVYVHDVEESTSHHKHSRVK
ncbi:alkaline shock response membrane anchor protein AmaP [Streptococcus cameli]